MDPSDHVGWRVRPGGPPRSVVPPTGFTRSLPTTSAVQRICTVRRRLSILICRVPSPCTDHPTSVLPDGRVPSRRATGAPEAARRSSKVGRLMGSHRTPARTRGQSNSCIAGAVSSWRRDRERERGARSGELELELSSPSAKPRQAGPRAMPYLARPCLDRRASNETRSSLLQNTR